MSFTFDRSRSPLAPRRRPGRYTTIAVWAIVVIASIIVAACLWKYYNPPEPPPKEKLPDVLGSVIDQRYQPAALPVLKPEAPPAPPPPVTDNWDDDPMPASGSPMKGGGGGQQQKSGELKPYVAIFPVPKKQVQAVAADGAKQQANADDVVYATSKMEGARAGRMGNSALRLDTGLLPCILDWDVDSTFGGPIQCHVPMDIISHGVVLLDRGTIVTGTYPGTVENGQKRMEAGVSTIDDRATGCFVTPGEMPITEANGMVGIPGSVDNRYGERFGAAAAFAATQMAVSLAQSIISAQSQNGRGNNSYYNFGGGSYGSNGIDQLAQTILQSQINIPPTVTLNHGTAIAVVIRKPIDFSHCYGLSVRH